MHPGAVHRPRRVDAVGRDPDHEEGVPVERQSRADGRAHAAQPLLREPSRDDRDALAAGGRWVEETPSERSDAGVF